MEKAMNLSKVQASRGAPGEALAEMHKRKARNIGASDSLRGRASRAGGRYRIEQVPPSSSNGYRGGEALHNVRSRNVSGDALMLSRKTAGFFGARGARMVGEAVKATAPMNRAVRKSSVAAASPQVAKLRAGIKRKAQVGAFLKKHDNTLTAATVGAGGLAAGYAGGRKTASRSLVGLGLGVIGAGAGTAGLIQSHRTRKDMAAMRGRNQAADALHSAMLYEARTGQRIPGSMRAQIGQRYMSANQAYRQRFGKKQKPAAAAK